VLGFCLVFVVLKKRNNNVDEMLNISHREFVRECLYALHYNLRPAHWIRAICIQTHWATKHRNYVWNILKLNLEFLLEFGLKRHIEKTFLNTLEKHLLCNLILIFVTNLIKTLVYSLKRHIEKHFLNTLEKHSLCNLILMFVTNLIKTLIINIIFTLNIKY
jgi:hypothetical protein